MQTSPVPRARMKRSTTSCSECQRRKQKCDQGQPCGNCSRRFPAVECQYGPRSKRSQKTGSGGAPNPDLPTFTVKLPPRPSQQRSPVPSPPVYVRKAVPHSPRGPRRRRSGLVVKWSGVDLTTEYPVYDSDDDGSGWETIQETVSQEDGVSTHLSSHDASVVAAESNPKILDKQLSQNVWRLSGPVDAMASLPIPATKQNALLVHTFTKLLHHFKGSFDGVPDSDNPFINNYVPWCIQSPLLAQTSLYISARSLSENQHIDQTSAMKLKGNAIHTLNSHLQSEHWISDEALAGVVQFVSIEWYFGGPEVVQAHLRGLREMLRLRGGFSSVGVGKLVTKVALVDDASIAMSLEKTPILQRGPGFDFDYRERPLEQFMARFNSPLLYGPFTFSSCVEALSFHPTTASILDDMRFLITTVLNLGDNPSTQEITKLQSTAMWIHDRISKLPVELPEVSGPGNTDVAAPDQSSTRPQEDDPEPRPHSLLPQYPSYTASSTQPAPHHRGPKLAPIKSRLPPPPRPDHLYTAVRLAAPLFARAIGTRRPFSAVCSSADALAILGAAWRIPLSRWRGVIGVLIFTFISIVATASGTDADAMLKPHAGETLGRAERLLSWLRGGVRDPSVPLREESHGEHGTTPPHSKVQHDEGHNTPVEDTERTEDENGPKERGT
ncbi:hypothetical protein QBC47DRAFT_452069 [Echria macrotheca]|uniref:Zn(2)-C6 fungal-type domain-containing protein n=1 Tax=Echria macrotheca TaxID=438768 RepID=A0AAJ0F6A2_9PEZI|nr:hypothetical protein QBC47DRAFT_452069 [Echria macrotheca]